jgi:hypothetical protein
MSRPVDVHVEELVLHGRADAAAVERSIVEQVTRALEERGLDPALAGSGGVDSLDAPAPGTAPGSIGRGVARSLTSGSVS